jgi:hypothetical protein
MVVGESCGRLQLGKSNVTVTSAKMRAPIISGLLAVCCWFVANWLILFRSSPLYEYFLYHGDIPNAWRLAHAVPYAIAILASGNSHQASNAAFLFIVCIAVFGAAACTTIAWRRLLRQLRRHRDVESGMVTFMSEPLSVQPAVYKKGRTERFGDGKIRSRPSPFFAFNFLSPVFLPAGRWRHV